MTINEKDRLDLRQELEKIFSNPRFADTAMEAMEAMPPIDYAQLATKRDLDGLRSEHAPLVRCSTRHSDDAGRLGHRRHLSRVSQATATDRLAPRATW